MKVIVNGRASERAKRDRRERRRNPENETNERTNERTGQRACASFDPPQLRSADGGC